MTEKEKAKELIESFYPICRSTDAETLQIEYAKQCALICCEKQKEILLSVIGSQKYLWTENEKDIYDELQKVKEEIKKQ